MVWLQENWIVAVVGLVVAVVLLWWLFGRGKTGTIAPPSAASAEAKKPLEPARPDIVAAEPARFKPVEVMPQPAAPPPPAPAPAPAQARVAPAEPAAPPAAATSDNLQLLKGVGPKLAALLNDLGVTSYQQIADWTEADIATIDPQLGAFTGRIARDNLVDQASHLARGDKAGFEAKYGALGSEL